MNFILIDHIENAYRTLRHNRARTALTTLGIAIGIASITTILALSSGVSRVIDSQLIASGGDSLVLIRPGTVAQNVNPLFSTSYVQTYGTSSLTEKDVQAVSKISGVDAVAPLMTIEATLRSDPSTSKNATIVATSPSLADISNLKVGDGQFIDPSINQNTAVLGAQLAIDLFGTDRPIGQTFFIRGQGFTVIGILQRINQPINYNNIDFDNAAIIGLDSGKIFHQNYTQIQQIDVRTKNPTLTASVVSAIKSTLQKNHLGETDYSIISGRTITAPSNQIFRALTDVMTAIAAISLFVGGIGIMNIMLVGVAERTREIGIRKAVGARNSTIVTQFMVESMMMSLIGGAIGYFVGNIMAFIVSAFLFFNPTLTWQTAAIDLAMTLVVGLVFGIYPAYRAARKDTIESLRQYH